MFRIICGMMVERTYDWLSQKILDNYSYSVTPDWFTDPIVRDELMAVDKVVDVNGYCLIKEDGSVIPPQWLCQGTRQFLYMTQGKYPVYDSTFFGVNVYPFFYRWANEKNVDVTITTCYMGEWRYPEMRGICLNDGTLFNSGREMQTAIINNKNTMLDSMSDDGKLWARKINNDRNGDIVYEGDPFYIDTGVDLKKYREDW